MGSVRARTERRDLVQMEVDGREVGLGLSGLQNLASSVSAFSSESRSIVPLLGYVLCRNER